MSGSSCSRVSPPRAACRAACCDLRPYLLTQYATVDGSRSVSRAIASIDSPASSRAASESLSMEANPSSIDGRKSGARNATGAADGRARAEEEIVGSNGALHAERLRDGVLVAL